MTPVSTFHSQVPTCVPSRKLSRRWRSRASSRTAFLLAVMSVRIEMYFSTSPSASPKGAMSVSTQ